LQEKPLRFKRIGEYDQKYDRSLSNFNPRNKQHLFYFNICEKDQTQGIEAVGFKILEIIWKPSD